MKYRGLLLLAATDALVLPTRNGYAPAAGRASRICMSGMWNSGLEYGKGLFTKYVGFDEWMKPFPDEDREAYPEMFALPEGVYEVALERPLGIAFEEVEQGGRKGVVVTELVEGGNAEKQGSIAPDDVLIATTAVKVIGAKWERRLIPARELDFDTIMGAIGSNEARWQCPDVIMQFARPSADALKVKAFLEFFEPPLDSPWRR